MPTTLYLSTDGFQDQIGEISDKKFRSKSLLYLLEKLSSLSLKEQKDVLEKEFINHKGNAEQTDDVLIVMYEI